MDTFKVGMKVKMLPHVHGYLDVIGTIERVLDDGRVYVAWNVGKNPGSILCRFHKETDLEIV